MVRILLIVLLASCLLVLPGPSVVFADTQLIVLQAGYNFNAITLAPAPPRTIDSLFDDVSSLKSVFWFHPLKQQFEFRLKLADDSLFGETGLINPGIGFVFNVTEAATLNITGSSMVNPELRELYNGFVLTGFPALSVQRKASDVLAAYYEVNSVFCWLPDSSRFDFYLRLNPEQNFGNDFYLEADQSYFISSKKSSTLNLETLLGGEALPTIQTITVSPTGLTVTTGASQAFTAIANWSDGSTMDVTSSCTWGIISSGGDGSFTGATFTATTAGTIRITATYNSVAGESALTIIPAPTVQSVSISPAGTTISVGSTQPFTARANWSDSTTSDVTGSSIWEAVSSGGSGTFSGTTFTATTAGSVRIIATYQAIVGETTLNVISVAGIQPGINVFSPLSSTSRKIATLDTFQSNEESIVILYEGTTTDSTYTFTFEGKTADAAPPLLSMSTPQAFPAADDFHGVDARNRGMEKVTLPVAQSAGGIRAPARAPQRAPTLGGTEYFWSLNSLNWPPSAADWTQVTATCQAVGQHCYMFEDNNTPSGYEKFPSAAWAELAAAFDNEIYSADTATFGSEPNPGIDGDHKVYILFTWNVNKQRASGYFDSTNEMTQAQADTLTGGIYRSNVKEIFFMQVPTTYDNWSTSLKNHILGVLSHEFLHMIVYNQHVMSGGSSNNEEDWLNEGLAQVAQDVSGYGYQKGTLSFTIQPFLSSTGSYSLTNFTFSLGQYGMSYLFCRYLADQGANLKNIVSTTNRGVANVESVMGQPFADLFRDWCITLYNSGTGISTETKYNFTNLNLRSTQADGTTFYGPQYYSQRNTWPFNASGSLRGTGVRYFRVYGGTGSSRQLEFLGSSSGKTGATVVRKNQ